MLQISNRNCVEYVIACGLCWSVKCAMDSNESQRHTHVVQIGTALCVCMMCISLEILRSHTDTQSHESPR